ncbi:MAG: S41 family peptidase [Candidatus Zixiibacteriota bacterium]
MMRYTAQLFGITIFALAMIWFAGPGDAGQLSKASEPVLYADTVELNVEELPRSQDSVSRSNDNFLRAVKKLTQTAFNIRNQYMEDVDIDKIVKAGISGMLTDLDRYSVVMEKSSYDALMESTHGKYEGLGMMIDARDNRIVIISPIEGTPAYKRGLHAGDIIWEIDGHSTDGMKSADASKLMRGKAGTSVKLVIKRQGLPELQEFEIERAEIELKSVNYAGVVPGTNIGYIRLSRFAEETSAELRAAINDLNNRNASALVFDLRSNGGGLLDQAKETSELFLKQGSEIVYTRGRYADSERHYKSDRPPIFPDKPLVVLVDEGTASASEIVAGALQDWDRALIVGNTTYGKGLVQQIFPISNDGSMALKLTTAKYYVPSGRCIQKADKQGKDHPGSMADDFDAEDSTADTMKVTDKEIYYTNGGRVVYGGGGIVPDIVMDRETWKPIEINLERKSMFFDFAVQYVADHPDVKPDFEITDQVLSEFRKFIKEKDFTYKSALQVALEDMEKTVKAENKDTLFQSQFNQMSSLIEKEKTADFDQSVDYIKRAIKREIVSSISGERGVYEQIVLKDDKAVQKAVEILSEPKEYSRMILEGQKKDKI